MTEYGLSDTLLKTGNTVSRTEKPETKSPWNKFLTILDSQPKMPASNVMTLFARTLAVAKSDWKDSNGNTLLMHMASRGKTAVVKRLIHELYANVNEVNKEGMTALHMAARGGFMDVCTELKDSNANPCAKNKNGDTPAMVAKGQGHAEVADFLQKAETSQYLWQNGMARGSR